MKKTFVISVGGSIVAPKEGIDTLFLKKFRSLILKQVKNGAKFFFIVGGGAVARSYSAAAAALGKTSSYDLDAMNIEATRLNAHLVKNLFGSAAYEKIILDPTLGVKTNKKIVIGGGWKPGWSTDFVAVKVAEKQGSPIVVNLSNIDYAYTADPKKYPDAKKLEKVSWKDFRKIVGNVWKPGLNAPFDPIASRLGEKLGLKVIIANGKNLKNLKNILNGKKYIGTTIN